MVEARCQPWCLDDTCDVELPEDTDVLNRLIATGTEILHTLSGGTVGLCERRIRPCGPVTGDPCAPETPCGCAPHCTYQVYSSSPIHCVTAVRVDGLELPRSAWREYEHGLIVFAPEWCPPVCQDLSKSAGEPGTWEIVYLEGRPPGLLASRALTRVVAYLARQCSRSCGVPVRGLTSITVEGASMELDPKKSQLVALEEVQQFLDHVNPHRDERQAAFFWAGDPAHWTERHYHV